MRIAISAFVCALALLLVSCDSNRLPAIKNPEQLRKDCAALHEQFPVDESMLATNSGYRYDYERGSPIGSVPKDKWPPSITTLKPFAVNSSKYGIDISILGIRGDVKGYFLPIHTNSLPRPAAHGFGPFDLIASRYDGIWEFYKPSLVH
jgi:hypothetical protein